jgi:hypothetical protein
MVSHTQPQWGFSPARSSLRTVLMSPSRSGAANVARMLRGPFGAERDRCRRRILMHARHVRAIPSGDLAEPLNAVTDNVFPQEGQVFSVIMMLPFFSRAHAESHPVVRYWRVSLTPSCTFHSYPFLSLIGWSVYATPLAILAYSAAGMITSNSRSLREASVTEFIEI